MALKSQELPDGNGETANRKAEHHDGYAGAHPREKGALVCKVITRAIYVLSGRRSNIATRWFRHESTRETPEKRMARFVRDPTVRHFEAVAR